MTVPIDRTRGDDRLAWMADIRDIFSVKACYQATIVDGVNCQN
ncbi:uncharacterized protein G2W53_018042 [Senna tora]|uniref:Uncharacterized protein n=1 Tax=Senna tora TaxID=362788 RepID=A0A834WN05_9FABA|nr:uncharacterized protein G2W53_018042 [Senna tora]